MGGYGIIIFFIFLSLLSALWVIQTLQHDRAMRKLDAEVEKLRELRSKKNDVETRLEIERRKKQGSGNGNGIPS